MLFDPKWEETVAPIKPLEPWQKVLLDAADKIERHGFYQGSYGDQQTGYCSLGAIYSAVDVVADHRKWWEMTSFVTAKMAAALRETYPIFMTSKDNESTIMIWNDREGRTSNEVVAIMRKAANAV